LATEGVDEVYALAANMGGIGFIESHKAVIVRDNTQINIHTIEAARINGVKRTRRARASIPDTCRTSRTWFP